MKESFIKKLIKILESSDLNSIHLSSFWGMSKVKLFKSAQTSTYTPLEKADKNVPIEVNDNLIEEASDNSKEMIDSEENPPKTSTSPSKNIQKITAPLVGTFYSSSKPSDPPFVKVGEKVEKGQILCIIEAMKIFNEIESEYSGYIAEILIQDSTPVEYGQDILLIDVVDD